MCAIGQEFNLAVANERMAAPTCLVFGPFPCPGVGVVPSQIRWAKRWLRPVTVELPTVVDPVAFLATGANEPGLPVAFSNRMFIIVHPKNGRRLLHISERGHPTDSPLVTQPCQAHPPISRMEGVSVRSLMSVPEAFHQTAFPSELWMQTSSGTPLPAKSTRMLCVPTGPLLST